jgi:hypothetical protein
MIGLTWLLPQSCPIVAFAARDDSRACQVPAVLHGSKQLLAVAIQRLSEPRASIRRPTNSAGETIDIGPLEFKMKQVLIASIALLLFGSGVWANLSVGSLSQNTGAWVSHSR